MIRFSRRRALDQIVVARRAELIDVDGERTIQSIDRTSVESVFRANVHLWWERRDTVTIT